MNDNNNYLKDDLDLVYNLYIIKTEYYFENLGYTCKNHRMTMMMLNDNTFLLFIELFILFTLGIRLEMFRNPQFSLNYLKNIAGFSPID